MHHRCCAAENCSRMRPPRPSPVNTPSREHISWTTTSATVMSTIKNSVRYPNCEPALA